MWLLQCNGLNLSVLIYLQCVWTLQTTTEDTPIELDGEPFFPPLVESGDVLAMKCGKFPWQRQLFGSALGFTGSGNV